MGETTSKIEGKSRIGLDYGKDVLKAQETKKIRELLGRFAKFRKSHVKLRWVRRKKLKPNGNLLGKAMRLIEHTKWIN